MTDQSRSTEQRGARIEAALRDYLERVDRGEPVDREAFLVRHAPIAEALRSFIAAEDVVRKLAGAETPLDRADDSTKSFVGRGQETIAPQSAAKRAADSGESGLTGRFGRYRIIRALGKGAMGTVYLADDTQLERQVALKTPHFTESLTEGSLERFYREARLAATLQQPNICPVHDVGQIDGKHYISMAYIEGRPLSAFIKPDKPQTERQILIVIRKLAFALQEAHDHGIVHRDLKPANIMVDKNGEPIIMDFGLARQTRGEGDIRLTQTGNIVGTPAYMSPEQVEGEPDNIGPPTDQYSLGVILYELLTGHLPFRGSVIAVMGQILTKEPPPPSQFRVDLDRRLEAVCLKMMAKTPSERFASTKAVADELATILKSPAARAASSHDKLPSSPAPPVASDRMRTDVGASQVLKSLKPKALTKSDLASLEELAGKCLARRDYDQVIQVVERIPEEKRNAGLVAHLDNARRKADEIAFLICDIDEAERLNDAQTAIKKADALLKVKPGHHRALEVRERYSGYGEGGAVRIGVLDQFRRPINDGGWIPWSALAFGLAVFGVMTGVIVIYLGRTAVVIDIQDPDVKVAVKGTTLTVTGPDKQSVKVIPGDQELTITSAGLETMTKSFTIKKGEKKTVTVSILDSKLVAWLENEIAPLTRADEEQASTPTASGNGPLLPPTRAPQPTTPGSVAIKFQAPQLLVAPFDQAAAKRGQDAWGSRLETPVVLSNAIGMKLALIPPGEFQMGSAGTTLQADTRPGHRVRVTKPFYMGIYEVTQEEFQRVMDANPSQFRDDPRLPVESMSWQHTQDFCRKLSAMPPEKQAGRTYRLPTEAEWEYACRAGTRTLFHFGDVMSSEQANFDGSNPGPNLPRGPNLGGTTKVGSYRPNSFGLYDMHGNVIEVVSDLYSADYYSTNPVDDPQGPTSGDVGVGRGGGWRNPAVPSAYRFAGPRSTVDSVVGFRVVCVLGRSPKEPPKAIAEDLRRRWEGSQSSSFMNLGNGKWREVVRDGSATFNFEEVTRTPEYVELFDKTRGDGGVRIRLRERDAQIIWGGRDNDWQPLQAGGWSPSAPTAGLDHRPPPPAPQSASAVPSLPNADRRAAAAVLALGGSVTILVNGGWRDIRPGRPLPDEAFLLTRLELHDKPQLTDADLEPLEGIANLNAFGLSNAPKLTDAIIAHLRNSTQLTSFWFENVSVGDAALMRLEHFTKLKSLGMRNTRVTDAGLVHLESLPQLEHIALGGTYITSSGLVHLRGLTQLAILWLERTKVGDAGLVHLERLSNLKGLILFGTRVTGAGLAHLKPLTRLEGLMLGGQKVTDASLACLQNLTSLKRLGLDGTRVTDAGLAHLELLIELRELNLRRTRVTSAGLAHLQRLQKLERLHLAGTHVTVSGLVHLRGLTTLKELDVSNTTITAADAEELKKSLPNCKITTKPIVPKK